MILLINTTDKEAEVIIKNKDQKISKKWFTQDLTLELLTNIDQLLAENGWSINNIKKIAACHGPGSFTSTRIGIACANALSYTLNAPIYGFDAGLDHDTVISDVEKINSNGLKLLKIKYSSPPKITISNS